MGLVGNLETNSIGGFGGGYGMPYGMPWGGGYGGFGGLGAIGLFGLIGLDGLRGRDGFGRGHGHECCDDGPGGREAAILAAIAGAKDTTVGEGRGLLAAIASSKDVNVAGFTALAADVCDTKAAVKDALYAQTIAGMQNTEAIKAQAQVFQIANDAKFEALSRQVSADGDATRALINANTIQDLRERLESCERNRSHRELEISIQNTNTNLQAQLQQQQQAIFNQREHDKRDHEFSIQNINTNIQQQQQQQQQLEVLKDRHHFDRRFDALLFAQNQINRNTQDVINFGTQVASANQANTQTNVK